MQTRRIYKGPGEKLFTRAKEDRNVALAFTCEDGKRYWIHHLWEIPKDREDLESFYGVSDNPYKAVIVRNYNPKNTSGPYEGTIEFTPSVPVPIAPLITKNVTLRVVGFPEDLDLLASNARIGYENHGNPAPIVSLEVEGLNGLPRLVDFRLNMRKKPGKSGETITLWGELYALFCTIPVRAYINIEKGSGLLETQL
ncbi:MAG: hypothetical protein U9M98_02570 [Patescibacteria group bacterium]|nr:hypothetical protein [Patescibacteria group bacterium]